jgi:hypothetical protein
MFPRAVSLYLPSAWGGFSQLHRLGRNLSEIMIGVDLGIAFIPQSRSSGSEPDSPTRHGTSIPP